MEGFCEHFWLPSYSQEIYWSLHLTAVPARVELYIYYGDSYTKSLGRTDLPDLQNNH